MKLGKITIDREYTKPSEEDQVRADIQNLRERGITAEDLLSWFIDCTGRTDVYGEVVRCTVDAFPAGWAYDNVTAFSVEMILDGVADMWRLRFCLDLVNGIHTGIDQFGGLRYTVTKYARV